MMKVFQIHPGWGMESGETLIGRDIPGWWVTRSSTVLPMGLASWSSAGAI